jgi:uncharacterized membrane protein
MDDRERAEYERYRQSDPQRPGDPYSYFEAPYRGHPYRGPERGYIMRPAKARFFQTPEFKKFWQKNKNTSIFMLIGLIIAILITTIGLGYTILIVVLVLVGYLFGSLKDGRESTINFLKRFF